MRLTHPLLLNGIGWLGAALFRGWMGSLRFTACAEDWRVAPPQCLRGVIYTLWHDAMLTCTYDGRDLGFHVMISQSNDGELATRIVERLGYKSIRGSGTRGSLRAVRGMQRAADRANLAITVDGPRGPRRVFQPGAIYLASRTGMPIVPLGVAYSRVWRTKSWDKFAVPLPFSHIALQFGMPLRVPGEIDAKELEAYCRQAQAAMDDAERRAERLLVHLQPPIAAPLTCDGVQNSVEATPPHDRGASRAA